MPVLLQALLFSLFTLINVNAKSVPNLSGPIVDQANLLGSSNEQALSSLLRQLNQQGILQMAILTVDDLEDETLEGYSIKVVDEWKLGNKEKDNGLLLLIAKNQRKVRLEVGQGLEGDIPDAIANRIIDGMTPYFKKGQFDQGILFAVASIAKKLGIEGVAKPRTSSRRSEKKGKRSILPTLIFMAIFFFIFRRNPLLAVLLLTGRSSRGYGGGFGGGGGFSGGGGGFSGGGASGDW